MKTMMLVREITNNGVTLSHLRIEDEFGILRDVFNLSRIEGGKTVIYPILAPIKVKNITVDSAIGDSTNDYTDAEYLWEIQKMLPRLPAIK